MKQRPKRLLSGLLRCAACGGGMSVSDKGKTGRTRIRCTTSIQSGGRDHSRRYYLDRY